MTREREIAEMTPDQLKYCRALAEYTLGQSRIVSEDKHLLANMVLKMAAEIDRLREGDRLRANNPQICCQCCGVIRCQHRNMSAEAIPDGP